MSLFKGQASLIDLSDRDIRDFARGLIKVFGYFQEFNHLSFNLGIYSGEYPGDDSFRVNARMVPEGYYRRSGPATSVILRKSTASLSIIKSLSGPVRK
jgi:hypothetical protein